MRTSQKILKSEGFTLVEVAIVLVIGGIILAGVTSGLTTYIDNTQRNAIQRQLQQIDDALQLYLSMNGRLPCAAPLNAAPDTAAFGIEIDPGNCAAAAVAGESVSVAGVRIGAVPVRSLNIPDDLAGDPWGNKITYAVTETLATAAYDPNNGSIAVLDSAGGSVINPPGSAHYIILSHGEIDSGATTLNGGGTFPCPAGNLETENCNNDATFRSTILAGSANNANFYDDYIRIRAVSSFNNPFPAGAVVPFNLAACPLGWNAFAPAQDRFIVGAGGAYNRNDQGGGDTVQLNNAELGYVPSAQTIDPTLIPGAIPFAQTTPGGAVPHDNLPPYVALIYCMKT